MEVYLLLCALLRIKFWTRNIKKKFYLSVNYGSVVRDKRKAAKLPPMYNFVFLLFDVIGKIETAFSMGTTYWAPFTSLFPDVFPTRFKEGIKNNLRRFHGIGGEWSPLGRRNWCLVPIKVDATLPILSITNAFLSRFLLQESKFLTFPFEVSTLFLDSKRYTLFYN